MITTNNSSAIFMVLYLLNDKSLESIHGSLEPTFLPNLDIENEPNLLSIINSLLDDMVEMGLCIERIDENYPPYNVRLYSKY